jgi:hypothetical protein
MGMLGLDRRATWLGSLAFALVACGGGGDDPGRGDSTSTSDGTAQPTSFTASATDSTSGSGSGSDATGETHDGSTGGISDSGGSTQCPATHACTPTPPTDWQGPTARATSLVAGAIDPACPDTYPELDNETFQGITAEPASCTCSCGPAVDASCEASATLRFHDTSSTCSNPAPQSVTVFSGTCNNLSLSYPGSRYWQLEPVETVGGTCDPSREMVKDDPVFETRFTTCGGAELLGGCAEGNVCAPRPPEDFDTALCIWQQGDHDCPSTYPDKELTFLDINDGRGCQTCSCGTPVGLCDSATALLFNLGCTGNIGAILAANNECDQTTSGNVNYASLSLGEPTAFCSPSNASPTGEATGRDPVTLCCNG